MQLNPPRSMIESISNMPKGTGRLAFQCLNTVLKEHKVGLKALDFGCGIGRSSRILKETGFDVTGVDISIDLLNEATSKKDDINYQLIQKNEYDFSKTGKNFDLIMLSFVLMEISSLKEIAQILTGLKKILSFNGKVVIIAASNSLYHGQWKSIDTNYPQNKQASSGDIVKVFLKDYKLEISDYLWTEEDCELLFYQAGLKVLEKLLPLAKSNDGEWEDELTTPPFVIYILASDGIK